MIFERIKSAGISHNSYFIGDGGHAAVIDPRRDCQIYVDIARREGLKISHIFETHRNEDFVIGSLELRSITGAQIFHGTGLDWKYGGTVSDGQEFCIGKLRLTALHTPGHTNESMSYVLTDTASGEAAIMVFTGDALFVNEVGRTDLYGPSEAARMASSLYDSIFERILPLGDEVILCPAHGGGSVCGGNIAERDESTLGIERRQNPVLRLKDKDDFMRFKMAEPLETPYYFKQMEQWNLNGPPLLTGFPDPAPLSPKAFATQMENGAIAIDTNLPTAFGGAHVKGTYSMLLDELPSFAGWIVPYDRPIVLVLEHQTHLATAVTYLIRLGYEHITSYLQGGMEHWYGQGLSIESLPVISAQALKEKTDRREELTVLDVRGGREWNSGHIPGAQHIYVGHLEREITRVDRSKPVAVVCSVGNRASLAASVLLRAGYEAFNVLGGMQSWSASKFPITNEQTQGRVSHAR